MSTGEVARGDWWGDYFDEVFLRIYEPLLPAAQTALEVDAIRELIGRGPLSILDVPCGWGRHSVDLALSGYEVTGVDGSPFLLEEARRRALERGASPRLVQCDMRQLDFHEEFDAALCLFSAIGYSTEDDDLALLHGIRRALRHGATLLIDTIHRDAIARNYVERDWWETPEGWMVWVERDFDPIAGVSEESLNWRRPDGVSGEKRHRIRVRTATELNDLLQRCGFRTVEWFGDWTLEPFDLNSEHLIVRCEANRAT